LSEQPIHPRRPAARQHEGHSQPKIKRRESFRPFVPPILREHVNESFEQDDDVPFMMEMFNFRAEKRASLPAVCRPPTPTRIRFTTC
jgi:predicted NodU family carbamoyl transferase